MHMNRDTPKPSAYTCEHGCCHVRAEAWPGRSGKGTRWTVTLNGAPASPSKIAERLGLAIASISYRISRGYCLQMRRQSAEREPIRAHDPASRALAARFCALRWPA